MGKDMNKNLQIKMGAALGYLNYVVKMISQLIYVPIMLRVLGQSEYGVYQLVASMISYLGLLNFGFGGAYLRFYAQCKEDRNREAELNGTFMIVFIIFAILASIVGTLLTINAGYILGDKLTNDELSLAKILLSILTCNMAITFPLSVFSSIVTSRECFVFQRVIELCKNLLNPFLLVLLLMLGYGSVGIVLITTGLTLLGAIITIWYVIKILKAPFSFIRFNKRLVSEISAFSFFLFLNSLIDQINWNVDKYLLGRFVGTIAIAVYSVGAQINNIYIQITDMLATVLAPRVNQIVANEEEPMKHLNTLFVQVGRLQSFIVYAVVFGFVVFGQEFIRIWAGEGYEEAYIVTLLLIIPVSIPLCQTLGVDIQRALNRHQYRSLIYACIAIGNLLISIPLAKMLGAVGTALGTFISLVLGNGIAMNIMYQRIIGLKIGPFWKEIVKTIPSAVLPFVTSLTIRYFVPINSLSTFIWQLTVFIVFYGICIYMFAMNKYEKGEITKWLTKRELKGK